MLRRRPSLALSIPPCAHSFPPSVVVAVVVAVVVVSLNNQVSLFEDVRARRVGISGALHSNEQQARAQVAVRDGQGGLDPRQQSARGCGSARD